jgi:hypothetical protein
MEKVGKVWNQTYSWHAINLVSIGWMLLDLILWNVFLFQYTGRLLFLSWFKSYVPVTLTGIKGIRVLWTHFSIFFFNIMYSPRAVSVNDNVCIEIQIHYNRQFTIQQRSLINILLTIYSKVIFLFLFNVSYLEFFLNGNKIKKNVKTFATPVRTIIIKM